MNRSAEIHHEAMQLAMQESLMPQGLLEDGLSDFERLFNPGRIRDTERAQNFLKALAQDPTLMVIMICTQNDTTRLIPAIGLIHDGQPLNLGNLGRYIETSPRLQDVSDAVNTIKANQRKNPEPGIVTGIYTIARNPNSIPDQLSLVVNTWNMQIADMFPQAAPYNAWIRELLKPADNS